MDAAPEQDQNVQEGPETPVVVTSIPQESATPNPQSPGGGYPAALKNNPIHADIEAQESGQVGPKLGVAQASDMDVIKGAYEQSAREMPLGLVGANEIGYNSRRFLEDTASQYAQVSGIPDLTPEQANQQYPGMPVPFESNVNPFVAKMRWDNEQRWKNQAAWMDTRTDFTASALKFGIGMTVGQLDPENLVKMLLVGPLLGAAGIAESIGSVFGTNAVMGLEQGINSAAQKQREQSEKADIGNIAYEAAQGAVMGTALHYGVFKPLHWLFGKSEDVVRQTPQDLNEQAIKRLIVQDSNGLPHDTSSIENEKASRERGDTRTGPSPYRLTDVTDISDRPWFIGREEGKNGTVEMDSLGRNGVQGTDNGQAMANRSDRMIQVNLPKGMKILDLDQKMTPLELHGILGDVSKELVPPNGIAPNTSIRDIMDQLQDKSVGDVLDEHGKAIETTGKPAEVIPPNLLDKFEAAVKGAGYEGYKYNGRDAQGNPIDNRIHLFGDTVQKLMTPQIGVPAVEHQEWVNDPKDRPSPSGLERQKLLDQMRDPAKGSMPDLDKEIKSDTKGKIQDSKPNKVEADHEALLESAQTTLQGHADAGVPGAQEALDSLKKIDVVDAQKLDMLKHLVGCMTGES